MIIHQFENSNLAQFSYAILEESLKQVILIDPARSLDPYLNWANEHKAMVIGVIETHPHADFVSSHYELFLRTRSKIYVSNKYGAKFPYTPFNHGDQIALGSLQLKCLETPGHSPDSISIVLEEHGKNIGIFSGDTLFIGDCGRPDLRESAGSIQVTRDLLARQLYHSLRNNYSNLEDSVILYPCHGAGSLCGKSLSSAKASTIGAEKLGNWALKDQSEDEFVKTLLEDQPFIPRYFAFDVQLNTQGPPIMEAELQAIICLNENKDGYLMEEGTLIIDTRPQTEFNEGHYPKSINLMNGKSFSTWLGSIFNPDESYYILAHNDAELDQILVDIAEIGYEKSIKATIATEGNPFNPPQEKVIDVLNIQDFKERPENYTILDLRNPNERKEKLIFPESISIPLYELRERIHEIPLGKPLVVHCAGGYRSAAGSSILRLYLNIHNPIYDLGTSIQEFMNLHGSILN